jgi:hypothetical protein
MRRKANQKIKMLIEVKKTDGDYLKHKHPIRLLHHLKDHVDWIFIIKNP